MIARRRADAWSDHRRAATRLRAGTVSSSRFAWRLRSGLAAAVVLAAFAPAGCSDDGPGKGEARLEVDGKALVERRDGEREVIDGSTDVGPGDRIEVTEGVATMALRGGSRFELRAGIGDAGDSVLVMSEVPVLEAGDLLVS